MKNNYASIRTRFGASVIDSVITAIITLVINYLLSSVFGASDKFAEPAAGIGYNLSILFSIVVWIIYYLHYIATTGQTLGKKIMKIKVVLEGGTKPMGYWKAFLREGIGKTISSLVIGLGYLWALWDPKKQGWHDKIAGTMVVNV